MPRSAIQESIDLRVKILNDNKFIKAIEDAAGAIKNCLAKGGRVFVAGNGGSASDAQHFAAEFEGRYKLERKGLPAMALTANSSTLTAIANDFDYAEVFARQLEAHGKPGDIFFGITTSGNSENIIRAVQRAKLSGIKTICLLGKGGGRLKRIADIEIIIPHDDTSRIQEVHIMIIHIICGKVEEDLAG